MPDFTTAFKDKVIWITGASSGIGEAVALVLAGHGAKLVLSARRQDALEAVKAACCAAPNNASADKIMVLPLDVTDDAAQDLAVKAVMDQFGRIDMLFNNAGISQRSLCVDTDMAVYRKLFEIDVFAQISLTKRVLPIMLKQRSGHMVVTASVAGKVGVALRTGYCAAKHAMMGFFDALRAEVDEHGIHVSTVVPGFIKTDISKNALKGDGSAFGILSQAIGGGMPVDEAAQVIVKGLARHEPEINVGNGKEMNVLWLKRLAPKRVFKLLAGLRRE